MKNKVLVKLYAPEFSRTFDIYIPVNYLVWKINKLIMKCVSDLCDISINLKNEFVLINKVTNEVYKNNSIIRETDIRNGTELIILSQHEKE